MFHYFITILFSLYIAQVRTGFILLFLGVVIYFLINSRIKIMRRLSFYVPVIAIIGTFLVMLTGSSLNDTSTLGRLVQYLQLMNEFSVFGSGMGKYAFDFDSLYIYLFLTYGVFSILFFYMQFWIINKLIIINNNLRKLDSKRYEFILVQFMIIYNLVSLYLFAFQHTLGAPTYFILYFLSFIVLSKANYKPKKEVLCE